MIKVDYINNQQECRTCKSIKDLNEFDKATRYNSGYDSECKICKRNYGKSRSKRIKDKEIGIDYLNNEYLSTDEVCCYLNISLATLYRKYNEYLMPIRKGKQYLYSKKVIDEYLSTEIILSKS